MRFLSPLARPFRAWVEGPSRALGQPVAWRCRAFPLRIGAVDEVLLSCSPSRPLPVHRWISRSGRLPGAETIFPCSRISAHRVHSYRPAALSQQRQNLNSHWSHHWLWPFLSRCDAGGHRVFRGANCACRNLPKRLPWPDPFCRAPLPVQVLQSPSSRFLRWSVSGYSWRTHCRAAGHRSDRRAGCAPGALRPDGYRCAARSVVDPHPCAGSWNPLTRPLALIPPCPFLSYPGARKYC